MEEATYVCNVASGPEALPLPDMEFDLPTANTSKRPPKTEVEAPSEGPAVLPLPQMQGDEEEGQ
jgi:hypothetical protein